MQTPAIIMSFRLQSPPANAFHLEPCLSDPDVHPRGPDHAMIKGQSNREPTHLVQLVTQVNWVDIIYPVSRFPSESTGPRTALQI